MSDRYPILVERLRLAQAATVVCERCDGKFMWDPSQGDPHDLCSKHGECGGQLVYMYDEAPKCKGCGTLGHHDKALNYCCSRVCMLQAEYAESLKARAS